ncbi:hypothetical protein E5288_WYG014519 [Bos mutus]|uniref:Uncharacterized protein n=1 Tax=Bos mutus TaxID=72004 RepID=A0A6B0R4J4_9CETA|nr:hypothetical protein [Bos mutus]
MAPFSIQSGKETSEERGRPLQTSLSICYSPGPGSTKPEASIMADRGSHKGDPFTHLKNQIQNDSNRVPVVLKSLVVEEPPGRKAWTCHPLGSMALEQSLLLSGLHFLAEHRRNSSPQGVAPEIRFKRHVQTNLQPINLYEETDLPRNKEVHVIPPGLRLAALNNQELTFWLWLDESTGWSKQLPVLYVGSVLECSILPAHETPIPPASSCPFLMELDTKTGIELGEQCAAITVHCGFLEEKPVGSQTKLKKDVEGTYRMFGKTQEVGTPKHHWKAFLGTTTTQSDMGTMDFDFPFSVLGAGADFRQWIGPECSSGTITSVLLTCSPAKWPFDVYQDLCRKAMSRELRMRKDKMFMAVLGPKLVVERSFCETAALFI